MTGTTNNKQLTSQIDIKTQEELGKKIFDKLSEDRKDTLNTIHQLSNYKDYNIYEMEIKYGYDVDDMAKVWDTTPNSTDIMKHLISLAVPGVEIPYEAPEYGCSAFTCREDTKDGDVADLSGSADKTNRKTPVYMGRNYDFKFDSSAMLVRCNPKNGYRSVSFAGLDHININNPLESTLTKIAALTSVFVPLDGMNEKGVSIAVLTLDSEPTIHNRGQRLLTPGTLIRLVLDRANSAEDAVKLLRNYDMYSICGRDYHYFITDRSNNGLVVEYDCETPDRQMKVTPSSAITNFYKLYEDRVKPFQKNGIYGHGKERYDAICDVMTKHEGAINKDVAWEALRAASQKPNPEDITSNTQWSALYDNANLEFEIALRRRWEDVFKFKL